MLGGPIYYVVLAAGLSRRFPGNKLLAEICGEPLIRAAVSAGLAAGLPAAVVTGNDRERIMGALEGLGVLEVRNPDYPLGMSTSVRAAISGLRASADALLLAPGDMPLLPPGVVRALADLYELRGVQLAAPSYRGERGHPVLLGRLLYDEALAALGGDSGLRQFLESRADALVDLEVDDPGVVIDVDAPADLAAAEEECRRRAFNINFR